MGASGRPQPPKPDSMGGRSGPIAPVGNWCTHHQPTVARRWQKSAFWPNLPCQGLKLATWLPPMAPNGAGGQQQQCWGVLNTNWAGWQWFTPNAPWGLGCAPCMPGGIQGARVHSVWSLITCVTTRSALFDDITSYRGGGGPAPAQVGGGRLRQTRVGCAKGIEHAQAP